jgi:cation transport regulator ChaB
MPITAKDAPSTLSGAAKTLYVGAWNGAYKSTCKERSDRDECASKIAWSAVKRKYKKSNDGKWVPKAEVASFSMAITRTSYDKLTNTRRWKAVASDTGDDLYNDNMTLELYEDFLQRIESKELPPESFRSDYWSGGIPYLSVSHYPDLNGKGVPGPVDAVYIDGRTDAGRGKLKASGRFDDTPIGKKCFQAISRDLDHENPTPDDEKIRISIAFLDWMHKHKSTGFVFDRAESEDVICPECLKELITGEYEGKEFLRGQLVHLALTRVPVNTRTKMEVERSMTTRKEDAESIIDELAEELEEEANVIGKSEALVIKSDEEVVEEPLVEEGKHGKDMKKDDEEEDEDDKKKKAKKEDKAEVVAEPEVDKTDLMINLLEEIKSEVVTEPAPAHPLDIAFSELKSVYDDAVELPNPQEALQMVQEPFEALAAVIQSGFSQEEPEEEVEVTQDTAVAKALSSLAEELGLLRAEVSTLKSQPQAVLPEQPVVPQRRSINPSLLAKAPAEKKSETPKLRSMVEASVGL